MLIERHPVSPALLIAHVRLMQRDGAETSDPKRIMRTARRYTSAVPGCAPLWLERLCIEKRYGSREETEKVWKDARECVKGEGIEEICQWKWGIES